MTAKRTRRASNITFSAAVLALYLYTLPVLLMYLLVAIWPDVPVAGDGDVTWGSSLNLFFYSTDNFPAETRLLLIVIVAGALGSFVHAATSFATFLGNRSLKPSWTLWYFLRPLIGAGIALIFYFLVRGGLLLLVQSPQSYSDISPFGIAAVASLAGMFSKQATDKLREVFDSLFKSAGDNQRDDKLWEQKPVAAEMIKRNQIQAYRLADGQSEADVTVESLYELFGPRVTRVPVFNTDWSLNCLIHQSLLYKFISQASVEASRGTSPAPFTLADHTLGEMLSKPGAGALARDAVAFVGPDATLADAKAAMEDVEGCQDVFVTDDGDSKGAVVGWLTNGMIAKLSGF
jgi:hypothetical protein